MRKTYSLSDDFEMSPSFEDGVTAPSSTTSSAPAGGVIAQPALGDDGDPFQLATNAGSVSASAGGAKPVATIAQLADYLVNGFWAYNSTIAHHWSSNTVSYNISGLNAAEQFLAQSALEAWHEVANVTFVQTSGAANITFNHNGSMTAFTSANWTGAGAITSATVDIAADWISNDGGALDGKTGIDSYGYQTYIHEIGHALGLGHQGPYNGSAVYSTDAIYADDTWQYSIMSYFAQDNYSGSTYRYVVTPQMADIYAVDSIYGAATTRTGDTVYGFHSNAGSVFDFSAYSQAPALTIYDSGGNDTLDCSGYSASQTIDLHPGAFSSVGGLVHNIGIALNTTIETAIAGSGNDTLIANDSACTLIGGAGNDTLIGGASNDRLVAGSGIDTMTGGGGANTFVFKTGDISSASGQHDRITDFVSGIDHIDLSGIDAISSTSAHDSFHFIGTSAFDGSAGELDYSYNSSLGVTVLRGDTTGGGVADFAIDLSGNVTITAADLIGAVGSSIIGTSPNLATHAPDFNGDGNSDLLFLNNTTAGVAMWELNGAQVLANPQIGTLASGFHFAHNGDFNGDGKTDLLMLNDTTHDVAVWEMNGTQVAQSATVGTINAAGGWQFADTGDFNGDGKTDLLMINGTTNGVAVWQMDGTQVTANPQVGVMPSGFHFASTGDFNGDGKTDLLMINDTTHDVSIWQMNGTQVTSATTVGTINAAAGWHFAGVGDFNGDGKTDLFFLNDTTHGAAVWQMNGNQVTASPQIGTINAAAGWHFADIGDFNGDGKSDLLFLNDATHGVAVWQMNGAQVTANPQVGIAASGDVYVGLQDINGDHKSDILFQNPTTHVLTAWEMNGTQIAVNEQIGTVNAAAGWHLVT
jgi:Ca2+-binding RTX toxin-like protein